MDNDLRELAYAIVDEGKVNSDAFNMVLQKLTSKQTEKFLTFLKAAQEKNTVTVTTANESDAVKKYFDTKYKNMQIIYNTDDTIGGGVIVKVADDVYDYSVRNYISNTITKVQEL
jgi:F0F1-type ATP synthase delta subunit